MNEMMKIVKRNGPGDMEGRGEVDEGKGKGEKRRARKLRKEDRWWTDFWNGNQTIHNHGDLWTE